MNQALDETSGANPANAPAKSQPKDATMRLLARYRDGVLEPYDTLDLPEGTEVELLLRLRK